MSAEYGTPARALELLNIRNSSATYTEKSHRATAHSVISLAKSVTKIAKSLSAIADEQRTANLLKSEELAIHPSRPSVPGGQPLTETEKKIIERLGL